MLGVSAFVGKILWCLMAFADVYESRLVRMILSKMDTQSALAF